jgi:peptidoglycan/xylan/chitin deacetylase (PgdA/CDA1 family)
MADRLGFLVERRIHALWFCRGDHLAERPEAAIQALRSGHLLGNHSWSHPRFSQLTLDQAADEIDRTEELLADLHERAGVPRGRKHFRFPYEDRIGSEEHHAALQEMLQARGYVLPLLEGVVDPRFLEHVRSRDVSLFWTYDSEDWTLRSPEDPEAAEKLAKVLERMDRDDPGGGCGLRRPGTEVIVMHDHAHTGEQWKAVVQGFLDRGLVFTGFGEG